VSEAHETIQYLNRCHDGSGTRSSIGDNEDDGHRIHHTHTGVEEDGEASAAPKNNTTTTPTGNNEDDEERSRSWSQGIVSRRLRILERRSPRNTANHRDDDDDDDDDAEGIHCGKDNDEVVVEKIDTMIDNWRSKDADGSDSTSEGLTSEMHRTHKLEGNQGHDDESDGKRDNGKITNFHTHNRQMEKEPLVDNENDDTMDNLVCEEERIVNDAFHDMVLTRRDDDAIHQPARVQPVGQDHPQVQHARTASAPRTFFDDDHDHDYDGIEQKSSGTSHESSTVNWDALAYSMSEERSADEFGGGEFAESSVSQPANNNFHTAPSLAKKSFPGEQREIDHEYGSFAPPSNFYGIIDESSTRTINKVPSDEEGGFTPRQSNASASTLNPTQQFNSTFPSPHDKSESRPDITYTSTYTSSPPSHLVDNKKIVINDQPPRLAPWEVPSENSSTSRIDLIKKRHDEEIEKIRKSRAANPQNPSSTPVGRVRSEEENVPMSPNSMNEINDLKERIIAMKRQHENAIQQVHSEVSDSDMMSPRRQQVAEMEIQSRIEQMTTQHKRNMESMRLALDNLKHEKGAGNTANTFDTPKSKVRRRMHNVQTDTSGDPNERHIAECVGLWKINAQRFEKAKEAIASCKNEQSERHGSNHFSFEGEDITNAAGSSENQAMGKANDRKVVLTPVKMSNEELMKINAELEEEIKKIQLLSPKSAKKRMDTVFGKEGLEAMASPSTAKNSMHGGSLATQKTFNKKESPTTASEPQQHHTPMTQPSPSRDSFNAIVANAKASDRKVNSRISSLIKDVTDFLAENDRMKKEMTQERLALNSEAF